MEVRVEGVKEMDTAMPYCTGAAAIDHSCSFRGFGKKDVKVLVWKCTETELPGLAGRKDLSLVWEEQPLELQRERAEKQMEGN